MKKVAILGGGIAGLAAAGILTQNKSIDVEIIEQSQSIGGRLQSHVIDGFTFDVGATLLTPYFLDFIKNTYDIEIPTVDIHWDVYSSPDKVLRIDRTKQAVKDFKTITGKSFFLPSIIKYSFKLLFSLNKLDELSTEELFSRLDLPEDLAIILNAGVINGGLPSDIASSKVLKLMRYAHHFKYPVGGTGQITQLLSKKIQEYGGQIFLDSNVSAIKEIGNKVEIDIITGEDQITRKYDYIISTMGVERTHEKLKFSNEKIIDNTEKLQDVESTIATTHLQYVYEGDIDSTFIGRASLNNFYPTNSVEDLNAKLHQIIQGKNPDPFGFYLNFPALVDRSLSHGNQHPISFWCVTTKTPDSGYIERLKLYLEKQVTDYFIRDFKESCQFLDASKPVYFTKFYNDPGTTSNIAARVNYPMFDAKISDRCYMAGAGVHYDLASSVIQASKSGYEVAKLLEDIISQ